MADVESREDRLARIRTVVDEIAMDPADADTRAILVPEHGPHAVTIGDLAWLLLLAEDQSSEEDPADKDEDGYFLEDWSRG